VKTASTLMHAVVDRLRERFSEHLVAVALFGSEARREATEESDLDFLVVLQGVPKSLERRYQVYRPIRDAVTMQSRTNRDVTAIDLDEEFISDEDAEITPLMLNIASDATILYDPKGQLAAFLRRIQRLIEVAGLKRCRTRNGKYGWRPKHGVLRIVEA